MEIKVPIGNVKPFYRRKNPRKYEEWSGQY